MGIVKYLSPKEASKYIGLSEAVLQKWRTQKKGIKYSKLGDAQTSRIVYEIKDLDDYLASKKIKVLEV